jgi:D-alanine-D-alanine ligase
MQSIKSLGLPLIIKPSCEGSSLGISLINNLGLLSEKIEYAHRYGHDILVEEFLKGEEYSVGIVGEQILPSVRICTSNSFYDYQAKYQLVDTSYLCPSGLSAARESEIQRLVYSAWHILGCKGWGRLDVMTDSSGKFNLLEANTVPGMTENSLLPIAARQAGMTFSELIVSIMEASS